MRIVQLTAENVKRLKVVDITPTEDLMLITGANESGKSSVLDSIWWALGGEKNISDVPIRKGSDSARVRIALGEPDHIELIAERKWSAGGTTSITVRDPTEYPTNTPDKKMTPKRSPQDILNALIGKLAFDPLEFAGMKPRDQYETLKSVVKLSVDLEALAAENDRDFAARRDLNRDAKAKAASAESIQIPPSLPPNRVDESELLNEMQSAGEHNAGIEREKARRAQLQRDAAGKTAEGVRSREHSAKRREQTSERIADLKRQIDHLQKEIARSAQEGETMTADLDRTATVTLEAAAIIEKEIDRLPALPAPKSITEIREAIEAAKRTNAGITQRERRVQLASEATAIERQAQTLTDRMAARDKQKVEALANAEFPVPDLSLDAGRVFYRGLPFDQASDSERLRVSTALAMAMNPKLKVIRIKDGSLLDSTRLQMLRELAKDRDYQVWIEMVNETGKVGVVMEDGMVES